MSDEERTREIYKGLDNIEEFARRFQLGDRAIIISESKLTKERVAEALKAKEREVLEREEMDSIIKTIKYMYQEISMGTGYRIGSGATLIWLSRLEEALAAFTRMKESMK